MWRVLESIRELIIGKSEDADVVDVPTCEMTSGADYGMDPSRHIKVGAGVMGVVNSRAYLSRLRGPKGEDVVFRRIGSTAPFETPNANGRMGLLDMYALRVDGTSHETTVYLNMYDRGEIRAPAGFTLLARGEIPAESPKIH